MEFIKEQLVQKSVEHFPVTNVEEIYYYDNKPELVPGIITHYFQAMSGTEKRHRFLLLRVVGGLNYIFRLGEISSPQTYGLSFKTDEYGYATVNLSEGDQEILGKTIAEFIESVSAQDNVDISEINISPASAGYSAKEIENCTEEILASTKNKLSRGEIEESYKGFEVFDLYRKLFDKDFNDKHYNDTNRARARSRYFKNMFRKHLPSWNVTDNPGSYSDFSLIRK